VDEFLKRRVARIIYKVCTGKRRGDEGMEMTQ